MKKFNLNKKQLDQLYSIEKKTMKVISEIFDCSEITISRRLHKYGIPIRPLSETNKNKHRKGLNLDKDLLNNLYTNQEKSIRKIAKILNCSSGTVSNYLHKYNIPIRPIPGCGKGKNNLNYGKSRSHGKCTCYGGIWMRSSWEVELAKWMDKNNIKWEYECKRFILKDRTYLPDFYLPEKQLWHEVKGWFHEQHQETIRQFREMYPQENILVLTKPIYESIIRS